MTIFLVQGGPLKSFMSDSHFFDLPPNDEHNRFLMVWVVTLDCPSKGEGNSTPPQYSCQENPTDGGACSSWGREESDTTERLHFHFSLSCIGEGNGNPLQCSCLENPRDGGPSWAAVYGVTQSQTWLMQLGNNSSVLLKCAYWSPNS